MSAWTQRLTQRLGQGFAWWRAELWGMVPPSVRRLLKPARPRPAVAFEGNDLVVLADGRTESGRIAIAAVGDAPDRRALVEGLLPAASDSERAVDVLLPASLVLHKILDLPEAAAENLRQVVTFDLDRQTPFTPEDVYLDVRLRAHDRGTRRLLVDLVVVSRETADRLVGTVRRCGLVPLALRVAWPDGDGPIVDLLPQPEARRTRRWLRPLSLGLAGCAAVLAVTAVQVPLARQQAQLEALAEDVQLARRQAEAGQRLRQDIERLTRQGRFLADRRQAQPPATAVIAELTRLLPDDTWLFRLRIFGTEAQIFGYSSSATALIGVLEQSAMFEDVQFRAPLTRDTRVDAERFHIGFHLKREAGQ